MFTPILMTFAGDGDAPREVAEEIAAILREELLETEVQPLQLVSGLEGYGTVMLGAPIADGHWDAEARAFLVAHRRELVALPVAVFATAPPGAEPEDMATDRGELLEELAQLRWLHPIAADLFRETREPSVTKAATPVGVSANGHGSPNGSVAAPGFDVDAVRTWARWVARVLQPVTR
jgi:menaquinone-dependent protoporphyrinogen IX oxidase